MYSKKLFETVGMYLTAYWVRFHTCKPIYRRDVTNKQLCMYSIC